MNPYFLSGEVDTPETFYPVLHLLLEEGDAGFDAGYTHLVEQVDGQRHFFRMRDGDHGSDRFLALHGLQPVSGSEMARLRELIAG